MRRCPRCQKEFPEEPEYFAVFRDKGRRRFGYCRPCERERARKQHAATQADPARAERYRERKRVAKREDRRRDPERIRATERRYLARRDSDPERRSAAAELRRIDNALRRERMGHELAPGERAPETDQLRVPPEPFVTWIRTRWQSAEAAAEATDLDPRLLRSYLDGAGTTRGIGLRIVDHAVTRAGFLLHDVYDAGEFPHLYD